MSAQQVKMTGAELKSVWKRSRLSEEVFQKKLAVGRNKLYALFKMDEIDDEVETIVDTDSELSKWKDSAIARLRQGPGPSPELYEKLVNSLATSVESNQIMIQAMAETNNVFTAFFKEAMKRGQIKLVQH